MTITGTTAGDPPASASLKSPASSRAASSSIRSSATSYKGRTRRAHQVRFPGRCVPRPRMGNQSTAWRARLGRLQHLGPAKAELMARLTLKERFFDPRPASRRPRRAAYALPTLFTAGNIFLGFIAILRAVEGALLGSTGQLGPNPHFEVAAKAIGAAVVLDGLDGRIARMTNTVSDFGREMDSLADVITFGIAPAVLAYTWGVQFVMPGGFLRITGPAISWPSSSCCAAPRAWLASTSRPTRCPRTPAVRIANTSSGCRYPPRPEWWQPSFMPTTACRWNGGFSRPYGSACWLCSRS